MKKERRIRNLKTNSPLYESEQKRVPELTKIQPELLNFPERLEKYARQINEELKASRKELAQLESSLVDPS